MWGPSGINNRFVRNYFTLNNFSIDISFFVIFANSIFSSVPVLSDIQCLLCCLFHMYLGFVSNKKWFQLQSRTLDYPPF